MSLPLLKLCFKIDLSLKEMKSNHEIFTSASYYSNNHARTFIMDSWGTYNKLENLRREEAGIPNKEKKEEKEKNSHE